MGISLDQQLTVCAEEAFSMLNENMRLRERIKQLEFENGALRARIENLEKPAICTATTDDLAGAGG